MKLDTNILLAYLIMALILLVIVLVSLPTLLNKPRKNSIRRKSKK